MLVVDATAALGAAQFTTGFAAFRGEAMVAPPLLWSEVLSGLNEALWRRQVSREQAAAIRRRFEEADIKERRHRRLHEEAWRLAESLGWAQTYDAEYVSLAALLRCRLVTADRRLRRATEHLGFVMLTDEL
jgi:predicted nucleic acid-binding protein